MKQDKMLMLQNRARIAGLRVEIAELKNSAGQYRETAQNADNPVSQAQCLRDAAVAEARAAEKRVELACLQNGCEYTPGTWLAVAAV